MTAAPLKVADRLRPYQREVVAGDCWTASCAGAA